MIAQLQKILCRRNTHAIICYVTLLIWYHAEELFDFKG